MKSLKFESLRVSSLEVGASLEFQNLNGNPAWKFEAAATRCAREQGEGPLENAQGFTEQPSGSSSKV